MVESFGWKSLTILYQDNHSLLRLQELLKAPMQSNTKIVLRKLSFGKGDDNTDVLLEVKQSGAIHIVLDCDQDHIKGVLSKADDVGLVTAYHSYLITNLDLHLVDLERFKDIGVNITSLRLVDPTLPKMIDTVKAWEEVGDKKSVSSGWRVNSNVRLGRILRTRATTEVTSTRFQYFESI